MARLDQTGTTLIDAGFVIVPNGNELTFLKNRKVIVRGSVIEAIERDWKGAADLAIDARNSVVLPGFVNCHVHVGAAAYSRGTAEDRKLVPGSSIYHYGIPFMRLAYKYLTEEEATAVVEWDLIELARRGSTTILEECFGKFDIIRNAVDRVGLRGYISLSYPTDVASIGYIADDQLIYYRPPLQDVEAGLEKSIAAVRRHTGEADDRIRVRLSPTGPDTCQPEVLRATRTAANELKCGISIHAAHHQTEIDFCRDKLGTTPIQHLAATGILGPDAIITHVVFTDDTDRRLLAESKSTVVHCSHRKALDSVIGPYQEYLDLGINVALGTDSYAHDMVKVMKMTAVLGKIQQQTNAAAQARDVVRSATVSGGVALGRSDLGRLEPGAKADLLVWDLTGSNLFPAMDPFNSMVHYGNGSDITHVMVDGRLLVQDRRMVTVDEAAVRARVGAAVDKVWHAATEEGILERAE